ncbi:hypothetical protein FRC12_022863, partial [Ceratobasidium sp. 428]
MNKSCSSHDASSPQSNLIFPPTLDMLSAALVLTFLASFVLAAPNGPLVTRADPAPDNIVYVTNADKFCMIMPRDPHTNIGDSEHPGGMKTYCSPNGRYNSTQGQFPANFWSN